MNFIYADSRMQDYMICPREVMKREDLPEGAKILYIHLLDRAKLSMQNGDWRDEGGRVYLVYPIQSLSRALHKGETAIKNGLRQLEAADLIERVHRGVGKPDLIFVKLPLLPGRQTEKRLPDRRKCVSQTGGNVSGNKNNLSKRDYTYSEGESL